MKILTSSYTLDLSGVPTFTLTMYRELVKLGHEVAVYSPLGGGLASKMKTYNRLQDIPRPDIIIAQHAFCAEELHNFFPRIPVIFYSHSIWLDPEQPPSFSPNWYFAINEGVKENLKNKGVEEKKITIVRDFVDTERFTSIQPINKKLTKVLFISNYKKWKNFKMVSAACKKLGVMLNCCGAPYGRRYKVEDEINKSDLVVSWGRGIIEGMSCGRAVVSFEKMRGDGYITPQTYYNARKDNFCGYISKRAFTSADQLAEELSKYDPDCSKANRDLIVKYHNVKSGVGQILENIRNILT